MRGILCYNQDFEQKWILKNPVQPRIASICRTMFPSGVYTSLHTPTWLVNKIRNLQVMLTIVSVIQDSAQCVIKVIS